MGEKLNKQLRKFRKDNNLTVKEVAKLLSEKKNKEVSNKTIYNWENGESVPGGETLIQLCEIYKLDDVLERFGYDVVKKDTEENDKKEGMVFLTPREKMIIEAYRKHPEFELAIRKLLDI